MIENARYEDAITALAALEDYKDAAEYMTQARYLLALDLRARGDYEDAITILDTLGVYEDARQLRQACLYEIAMERAAQGNLAGAIAQLNDLRGYQDANEKVQEFAYQLGLDAEEHGDLAAAAMYYDMAGSYQDAADRAQRTADQYYAEAYATAVAAMEQKDYKTAAEALMPLSREYLSEKYADIPAMFQEACYNWANQLYSEKKPFEALVYYRQITDYKDVATARLKKIVYQMMGTWESSKGIVMEFREDGTCTIENRNYYYYTPNVYALQIGDQPDSLNYTYEIVSFGENSMTLRHVKLKTLYRMTRVKD
ncbi:MAG: hypothetical protein IJJ60_12230, partial [Clostridia bacterium]|nr:hypothetical protein [Clostridia bacterium]